ncbi:hypothetical protein [Lysobacter terrae]
MISTVCPVCRCDAQSPQHAIVAALSADDLDAAIEAGLLTAVACDGCSAACTALVANARDARLRALAARERYRARQARLLRRAQERAAASALPASAAEVDTKPALPSAAAAALARAKARAADRRKP